MSFSARQVRAGRALVGWSAADLAARAGLEEEAIELFEGEVADLSENERHAIANALYAGGRGVIALGSDRAGEGVRLARAR